MSFQSETRVKRGRKPHHCDYCGRTIPHGAPSVRIVGTFDGFFSARGHVDCVEMWHEAFSSYADGDDEMAFDLLEAIGGEQCELDAWRGHYPHVVCRIEFHLQKSGLIYRDKYGF